MLYTLFDSITKGSGKLYDGLPALCLDGQVLAVVITTHLTQPVIHSPQTLLHSLCATAGLYMGQATDVLRATIGGLWPQAEVIGEVVQCSQKF